MDGSRFDDLTRTLATGVSAAARSNFFLGAVAAGLTVGVARDATAQSESDWPRPAEVPTGVPASAATRATAAARRFPA